MSTFSSFALRMVLDEIRPTANLSSDARYLLRVLRFS
nr:MAG TPA: hypothetical protein [Caudoviricetes sp.]